MATAPCWGKGKKAAATPSVRRLDPEARGLRFLADPAAASRHGSGPVWMWRGSSCRAFASARSGVWAAAGVVVVGVRGIIFSHPHPASPMDQDHSLEGLADLELKVCDLELDVCTGVAHQG